MKGKALKLAVNTGTADVPVWAVVAKQRGFTLNRSADEIDTTSKDSDDWYEGVPSIKNWSMDLDGLLVEDDTGYGALETAYINGDILKVQLAMPSGAKYEGQCYMTDFPIEAPYDDNVTYSASLKGTGALTKTPKA